MRKRLVLLLLLVVSNCIMVSGRIPDTVTTITIDGDITVAFVRDAAGAVIEFDSGSGNRGFLEFDTSTIPGTAIVDKITVTFKTEVINGAPNIRFEEMTVQPSTEADNAAGNQAIYDDIGANTQYTTQVLNDETWYTVDLGADACTDHMTHLTWFSVGIETNTINNFIYSSESLGNEPYLTVSWHLATDYEYQFTDTYYENGTRYHPPVEVTATNSFAETFNTSGGTTEYYPLDPSHFYWDLGGGITRYIYSNDSENFTVTMPESTYAIYSFTIKDYIGAIGTGDAYLEAYRVINSTSTLIERMKIIQPNPTPLNLVVGRTYHIMILLPDGTRYDWGYYVTTSTTTASILLRDIQWGDQAQILFNTITVQATRAGATITVNYDDEREDTTWANVTIRVRNGAIVLNAPRNNDTYTINYTPINETLNYVVTVTGEHGYYGEWGRSFIFDAVQTYPDAPSLDGIFGTVGRDFIPVIICLTGMLSFFGKRFYVGGLMAGMMLASFFSFYGWASWGYDYLVFGWFIVILASINMLHDGGSG